jgi:hypothetical protein
MALGKPKEFTLHTYWHPQEQDLEFRIIGSLRPPNELVDRAREIVHSSADESQYKGVSDSTPVYVGQVTVGMIYVAGDSEENAVREESDDFSGIYRVENSEAVMVGDRIGESYGSKNKPYQDKGWTDLKGDYYTPSSKKPDDWFTED